MSFLLLGGCLPGCVPKGAHEMSVVQLEATRTALSARTAQCIEDANAAEAEKAALRAEIAARQLQLDELAARGAVRDQELAELTRRQLELLEALADASAEIEALKAELSRKKRPPPAPVQPSEPSAVQLATEEVKAAILAHREEELERTRLLEARAATEEAFASLVAEGRAEVVPRGDHTVVRIPTRLLFQEGFSTLSPRGSDIVSQVAQALRSVPGRIITIEAHTDARPVHTAEFPSNWERGFTYALAVLRALEGSEAPGRFSAASFADTRPLVPQDGPEAERNERIEMLLRVDPELAERFAPTPPAPEPVAPEPIPQP